MSVLQPHDHEGEAPCRVLQEPGRGGIRGISCVSAGLNMPWFVYRLCIGGTIVHDCSLAS